MSPLLLAILRALTRPTAPVPTQPSPSLAVAWDRIAAAARTAERQRVWAAMVAAKADALTQADVDALFEQLEDERAGGAA